MSKYNVKKESLTLDELRAQWQRAWQIIPHNRIGRKMLERSLEYKQNERQFTKRQQEQLDKIIQNYKRNPNCFEQGHMVLKTGTKILREWKGDTHAVTVTPNGFRYQDKEYSSLSKIASEITGARWNGWVFFGIKNKKENV